MPERIQCYRKVQLRLFIMMVILLLGLSAGCSSGPIDEQGSPLIPSMDQPDPNFRYLSTEEVLNTLKQYGVELSPVENIAPEDTGVILGLAPAVYQLEIADTPFEIQIYEFADRAERKRAEQALELDHDLYQIFQRNLFSNNILLRWSWQKMIETAWPLWGQQGTEEWLHHSQALTDIQKRCQYAFLGLNKGLLRLYEYEDENWRVRGRGYGFPTIWFYHDEDGVLRGDRDESGQYLVELEYLGDEIIRNIEYSLKLASSSSSISGSSYSAEEDDLPQRSFSLSLNASNWDIAAEDAGLIITLRYEGQEEVLALQAQEFKISPESMEQARAAGLW